MEEIVTFTEINFTSLFLQICSILIGIKAVLSAFEWLISKLGLETKGMRQRREDHELLIQTSQSLQKISQMQNDRDEQIKALMRGSKELLGAEIDKRYREYISLKGIPESEVDEFEDIFAAYKELNGNHGRDTKYYYVKNHLPVIPVETKLMINDTGFTKS